MKELVEHLARILVSDPASVEVVESEHDGAVVIELRVPPAEIGRVIGREGRTARALRALVAAAASRQRRHAVLDIVEEPR